MNERFRDRLEMAKRYMEKSGKEFFGHHEKNERDELIFIGMNRAERRDAVKQSRRRRQGQGKR